MPDSANTNRREKRMLATASRLTSVARRLTAERGLSGFTVEEVCDEVDVSRRTFFNYFPSKEDAVLGVDPGEELEKFSEAFLARGSRGWAVVIDDLVELVIGHFEATGHDHAGHAEFIAAIEREPRLLLRFMGATRERERQAVAVVASRENVPADDPRAEAVVGILSTLLKHAGEHYLDPAGTHDFSSTLRNHLAALRVVMAPPTTPRKATL
ncbi:TetR family transcriptional regulator [Mycetocola sp. 2940]|uniref:TetR/AcrR family transcriptional regulator n=1 Tax=Mycetocola sp. 2940 TaxID=3156452 RepID=UPI003393617F